jgi:hypothetical protein
MAMRYPILACDFDGTLARDGRVAPPTLDALRRFRAAGGHLILVTGRELDDLYKTFDHVSLFTRVVAENGGVLHCPATKDESILGPAPTETFTRALMERRVHPLSIGQVIVATERPHETTLLHVIRDLGLEMQVIFNKDSVMALPSGVNKATGLSAALAEIGFSEKQTVGVGDAENDHAFLRVCGYSAAVANALPALKAEVDVVLNGTDGAGVAELVGLVLAQDAPTAAKSGTQNGGGGSR